MVKSSGKPDGKRLWSTDGNALGGTLPTFLSFFPLIRKVLLRERIDLVHGHQATSNLAHEWLGFPNSGLDCLEDAGHAAN